MNALVIGVGLSGLEPLRSVKRGQIEAAAKELISRPRRLHSLRLLELPTLTRSRRIQKRMLDRPRCVGEQHVELAQQGSVIVWDRTADGRPGGDTAVGP